MRVSMQLWHFPAIL